MSLSNLKVKVTTGFSDDQKFTIDAEEAHKAYYLFRNPEKRGVFNNGIALIGKDIRSIQPDYHASMGWNSSHKLDDDDWNEINGKVRDKLSDVMEYAKEVSDQMIANPNLINLPLSSIPRLEAPKQNTIPLLEGINKL